MAINNLAEQCYISTYGPLENMNMLTKMDMVKVQMKYLCWYFFRGRGGHATNWLVSGWFAGDLTVGVHSGQDGDREEGEDTAEVGICVNKSDSSDRQEGEGIHERQHDTTQKSK